MTLRLLKEFNVLQLRLDGLTIAHNSFFVQPSFWLWHHSANSTLLDLFEPSSYIFSITQPWKYLHDVITRGIRSTINNFLVLYNFVGISSKSMYITSDLLIICNLLRRWARFGWFLLLFFVSVIQCLYGDIFWLAL